MMNQRLKALAEALRKDAQGHIAIEDLISAVFGHWEDDAQRERVEAHLSSCETCSGMIARERERNSFVGMSKEELREAQLEAERSLKGGK